MFAADRNLLFGVIALRMNFVVKDRMIAAMQEWFLEKSKPLGQILCENGDLTPDTRGVLDKLVDHHLELHGGDIHDSISSLSSSIVSGLEFFGIGTSDSRSNGKPGLAAVQLTDEASRFHILRPHAKGGLGEVFVAEDKQLHREVALKEIQARHAGSAESRERFVLEAEITGGLEHPGVVPVYGLGCHSDGRPFYAMRFIKGDSMKEAIRRLHESTSLSRSSKMLELRKLLGRFIAVCQATAYAHSRGVVHRDLKPSNIMLGKFGETLVVDWGLAKAVGREKSFAPDVTLPADPTLRPGSGSAVVTFAGQVLGTPAYMSPEQAAGKLNDVGPASDVFSLGATLYTLLTGQARVEGPADEVLTKVETGDFPSPRTINPEVPLALEAICLKALALKPSERYASPLELAAELENWLADEPVHAWPEPWSVRAWRCVRHHRTAVTAAAVLLATAAVGLGVSTVLVWREERKTDTQRLIAEQQRSRAEENLDLARDITVQLMDLEKELPRDAQSLAIYRGFLENTLTSYKKVLAEGPDDPNRREITAWLYRYTANANRVATTKFAATNQMYEESIRLLDALVHEFPGRAAYQNQLAETLWDHAKCLSLTERRQSEAVATLVRSIEIARRLRKIDPKRNDYKRTLALSLSDLSIQRTRDNRYSECAAATREAVDLFGEILNSGQPPHPRDQYFRGVSLNRLAIALRELGDNVESLARHNEAVDLLRKECVGSNNDTALNALGRALCDFGRTLARLTDETNRTEEVLNESIAIWERLLTHQPNNGTYHQCHAVALTARGRVRSADSELRRGAAADLEKAIAILEALTKAKPNMASFHADLGRAYFGLGRVAIANGDVETGRQRFDEARNSLDRALEIDPNHENIKRSRAEVDALVDKPGGGE